MNKSIPSLASCNVPGPSTASRVRRMRASLNLTLDGCVGTAMCQLRCARQMPVCKPFLHVHQMSVIPQPRTALCRPPIGSFDRQPIAQTRSHHSCYSNYLSGSKWSGGAGSTRSAWLTGASRSASSAATAARRRSGSRRSSAARWCSASYRTDAGQSVAAPSV